MHWSQDFAALLQMRKYDWLLDAAWLRDEDFVESDNPVLRSELDAEAYELVTRLRICISSKLRGFALR